MHTKLKQHLAIATGAVSAAAVPMGADAAIVYKDSSNAFSVSYSGVVPGSETVEPWDIDGDGANDFQLVALRVSALSYIYLESEDRSGNPLNGRGAVAVPGKHVNNLTTGFSVGASLGTAYAWRSGANYIDLLHGSAVAPGFGNGVLGSNFIGFRFLAGTDLLYGWGEMILSTTDGGTATINRWAYEDTPDCAIAVGQTSGDNCPEPVPTPPTLALLAAGAFGLRRWRAQRAAA